MQSKNHSYIAIDATPAFLDRLTAPGGIDANATAVPIVPAHYSAAEFIRQNRGVQTRATMLQFGPCAVGIFLLRCEPELVAVLFDVCEPGIRDWLNDGARRGLLRVGLRDARSVCVVDVSNSDVVDALRAAAQFGRLCSNDDLVRAIGTMVNALGDDAGHKLLGIDDIDIERVTLALVSPRETHTPATPRSAH